MLIVRLVTSKQALGDERSTPAEAARALPSVRHPRRADSSRSRPRLTPRGWSAELSPPLGGEGRRDRAAPHCRKSALEGGLQGQVRAHKGWRTGWGLAPLQDKLTPGKTRPSEQTQVVRVCSGVWPLCRAHTPASERPSVVKEASAGGWHPRGEARTLHGPAAQTGPTKGQLLNLATVVCSHDSRGNLAGHLCKRPKMLYLGNSFTPHSSDTWL